MSKTVRLVERDTNHSDQYNRMTTRMLERVILLAAIVVLFLLVVGTNGRVTKVARTESSRFAHLEHRINTLRSRMDAPSTPQVTEMKKQTTTTEQESQPSAFDPSSGLPAFDMPTSMHA